MNKQVEDGHCVELEKAANKYAERFSLWLRSLIVECFMSGAQWMKKQTLKVVQQYADKGYDNLQESIKRDGEDSHIAAYWDGFADCANAIQREFNEEQ